MKSMLGIFIIIFLLLYEKVWRPIIIKKKIYSHIEILDGQVNTIESLTPRDEIYSVYYSVDGQSNHANVKFNFFYNAKWE